MGSIQSIEELIAWSKSAPSTTDIDWFLRKLQGGYNWGKDQCCDFSEGDKVIIARPIKMDGNHGWRPYRECLAIGATATCTGIEFIAPFKGEDKSKSHWAASIILDDEWSIGHNAQGEINNRYWAGPADKTPDGFTPPSDYDREHYPEGRKHTFSMNVNYLRRAE